MSSSGAFRSLLKDRIELETKNLSDWKLLTLVHPQDSHLLETVHKVLTSETASLLRPINTTVQQLQAFPLFVGQKDPLILRLWKATFLCLVPETFQLQDYPPVLLQYPFILFDYQHFLSLPSLEPVGS